MQWLVSWLKRVMSTALVLFFLSFLLGENLWIIQCLVDSKVLLHGLVYLPKLILPYFCLLFIIYTSVPTPLLFCFVFFVFDFPMLLMHTNLCRQPQDWVKIKSNNAWILNWRENILLKELQRYLTPPSSSFTVNFLIRFSLMWRGIGRSNDVKCDAENIHFVMVLLKRLIANTSKFICPLLWYKHMYTNEG